LFVHRFSPQKTGLFEMWFKELVERLKEQGKEITDTRD